MNFLNQQLNIFEKGNFKEIDRDFITETTNAIIPIMNIQTKYNKKDNDSFFNELKDGMIAIYLGFDLINTEKHGLDAKKSDSNEFLEVKQVSFSSKSWSATFNDTTLEKAEAFKDVKTTLALGVWDGMADLLFIVYGKNPKIGDYLEQKVIECHQNKKNQLKH